MNSLQKYFALTAFSVSSVLGTVNSVSANPAARLICTYQADDGATWQRSYAYPATQQCPPTSSGGGKVGVLINQEIEYP